MRYIFSLLLILFFFSPSLAAQEPIYSQTVVKDSVLYTTTFNFEKNQGEWIERYDYLKAGRLLDWIQKNDSTLIDIKGWCDPSGTEQLNDKLSFKRAKTIHSYLVKKGVDASRITFEGKGIDHDSEYKKARRADVVIFTRVVEEIAPQETMTKELVAEKMEEQPVVKESTTPTPVTIAVAPEEPQSTPEVQEEDTPDQEKYPVFYATAGVGTSFGRSSFASFAEARARVGVNTHLSVGVDFNSLLSAELNLGYTAMTLGMYDCCERLYYADGERYFAPVAGLENYAYRDLVAKTNLFTIAVQANFNLVSLFNKESKWQALVSPNVGVGFSRAKLQHDNSTIDKESNTHFILGGVLGAGYSLSEKWGVRLTSGVDYWMGGAFDAIPQYEHINGYIWNTTASAIYKF